MLRILLALSCAALLAHGAHATPVSTITDLTLPVYFTPNGGDFGRGILVLDGVTSLVVDYENSQTTIDDISFYLSASFCVDLSIGEQATGVFVGGEVLLRSASGSNLLTGNTLTFALTEDIDTGGLLLTTGSFDVLSGSLQDIFGSAGAMYDTEIVVDPASIRNFNSPFTGFIGSAPYDEQVDDPSPASVPAVVIPEPMTIAFLSMGLAGLYLRRKAHS
ncbi:MAG: PEP-CTERM sorting domain-containing protein [Planctomycetes bacterium]|nr:PEP-CTERM sorting domain-containing protein [Planctomycetota bacterium]